MNAEEPGCIVADSQFFKFKVTNHTTGDVFLYFEDQVQIEIECEFGMISVTTPDVGSREFLLSSDELEIARQEVGL